MRVPVGMAQEWDLVSHCQHSHLPCPLALLVI